jgi:acetyl esterase/lipase
VERVAYGREPDQRVEVRRPAEPLGVAVLLHGGFWREVWRCDLMNAVAVDLTTRGWVTWNVEYRRVGRRGDAWPELLEDAGAAALALDADEAVAGLPVVTVGHSAGGQIALWLAARLVRGGRRIDGAVGLAALSDLRSAARQHLAGDAVADLLGAMPDEVPERVEAADPRGLLPLGAPVLLVHGERDQAVPVTMSREFAAAASAAGDAVELLELPGVGHSALVDPAQPFWEDIRAWMDARVAAVR